MSLIDFTGERRQVREPPGVRATPFVWRDPATIPTRQWLFGRHAIRRYISATVATGGVGKTSLLLGEALAYASGRDLFADSLTGRGGVWYIGLEDPLEEYERRIAAAALHHGITLADIDGRLFLDTGREQDFVVARERNGAISIAEPIVAAIIAQCRENAIGLIIVDPFVASHAVPESDNTAIAAVARTWARIAEEANCAVELVHHVRKGGGQGEDPSADDARGASALVNAARSVRLLTAMTKEQAERAGVDERRRFFRIMNGKANLALPPEAGLWRQLVSVPLGNGNGGPDDIVGVAARWTWPSAFDGVTAADLYAVQRRIADGQWRKDVQAKDWAGNAVAEVLDLDGSDKAVRARINRLLSVWIENGALIVTDGKDQKGNPRKFVSVGGWAT